MSRPKIGLVDIASSGLHLSKIFRQNGYLVVHIRASQIYPDSFLKNFTFENFDEEIKNDSTYSNLLEECRKKELLFVLPGNESGVTLADQLSFDLELPSNGIQFTKAKRCKYTMIETIKSRGLLGARQYKSSSFREIQNFVSEHLNYPLIIKPLASACADNVYVCQDEVHMKWAYDQILNQLDGYKKRNEEVLVQERLEGQEYIVNTVTREENTYICDIWKCEKIAHRKGGILSLAEILLDPNAPEVESLSLYAQKVVKALGIKYGPCHLELMLTSEGPKLIEVGARVQGCIQPDVIREATGTSQLELTYLCYHDRKKFDLQTKAPYQKLKSMCHIFGHSLRSGVVKGESALNEIRNFNSFKKVTPLYQLGQFLPETENLFTITGIVDLLGDNDEEVLKDFQLYKEIISSYGGLFDV